MVPTVRGKGVAASAPILTEVMTTLVASVPPVLAMLIWATTLPLERESVLVTMRLAGVAGGSGVATVGVNETPLKLESDGAVASRAKVSSAACAGVVKARVSVMP